MAHPEIDMSRGVLKDGSFEEDRIRDMMQDIQDEPQWRHTAAMEAELFDSNQLRQETVARMEAAGLPPIVVNLVKPALEAVGGIERTMRTDPEVMPETAEHFDGAMALNERLKVAVRLSNFNRSFSNAFMDSLKVGIGWCEIGEQSDPFKYRHRAGEVRWQEMFWDWRARDWILDDARYMVRKQYFDLDHVVAFFPKHRQRILNYGHTEGPSTYEHLDIPDPEGYVRDSNHVRESPIDYREWWNHARQRVALHEVWYRTYMVVTAMEFPDGRVLEYDKTNPRHAAAVAHGFVKLRSGPSYKLRRAYYLGPNRLVDTPTPYGHAHFPYVPVFCFRESNTLIPYGFIRQQKSPQEVVNSRWTRIMHDLSSNKVVIDEDAVENHATAAAEWAKPNAWLVLKTTRRREKGFDSNDGREMNPAHLALLEEGKTNIHESTGLYPSIQGETAGAQQSGRAVEKLVEQSMKVLGGPFDNYFAARQRGAEILMANEALAIRDYDDMTVEIPQTPNSPARSVTLNKREGDKGRRNNDVLLLRTKVALSETPTSPTYMRQQFAHLVEFLKTIPPEIAAQGSDILAQMSGLAHGEELAKRFGAVLGHGQNADPEQQAEQQAAARQKAETEAKLNELAMRKAEAETAEAEAKAQVAQAQAEMKIPADTELTQAKTDLAEAQAAKAAAEAEVVPVDAATKALDTRSRVVESSARLTHEAAQARKDPDKGGDS